jgi:hypothetical protein
LGRSLTGTALLGPCDGDGEALRESKFSTTGQLFGEMKEFLERANPGISATMEIYLYKEDHKYGLGARKFQRYDEGREQYRSFQLQHFVRAGVGGITNYNNFHTSR